MAGTGTVGIANLRRTGTSAMHRVVTSSIPQLSTASHITCDPTPETEPGES
jgi:hypothetical protein